MVLTAEHGVGHKDILHTLGMWTSRPRAYEHLEDEVRVTSGVGGSSGSWSSSSWGFRSAAISGREASAHEADIGFQLTMSTRMYPKI